MTDRRRHPKRDTTFQHTNAVCPQSRNPPTSMKFYSHTQTILVCTHTLLLPLPPPCLSSVLNAACFCFFVVRSVRRPKCPSKKGTLTQDRTGQDREEKKQRKGVPTHREANQEKACRERGENTSFPVLLLYPLGRVLRRLLLLFPPSPPGVLHFTRHSTDGSRPTCGIRTRCTGQQWRSALDDGGR